MEDLLAEKLLTEVRDRVSDAMAAMQLLTPLVRDKGSQNDREYLAAMNKSFYRLIRMIHHLEAYDLGELTEPAPLDLAGLCRDICEQSVFFAQRLGIAFDWSLSDSSVLSLGSDHLLGLAVLNLLTNAFEAAGEGGWARLEGSLEKGYWQIRVMDSGAGFPDRTREGDPFLKTSGGTGLGLETVRRVAELHGGVLLTEDKKEGKQTGVRAMLALPVRKVQGETLCACKIPLELWGGFSPALVEFSPLLPLGEFSIEDTE